jgi:hypothetical protein
MSDKFDEMVLGSQMAQSKAGEHALWKEAFALECWFMLGIGEGEDLEPMFAQYEGNTHLLAFTDGERAEAMAGSLEEKSGQRPTVLHMEVADAIEYLRALDENRDEDGQVAGAHFNNGDFAFGASLVSIIDMYGRYSS